MTKKIDVMKYFGKERSEFDKAQERCLMVIIGVVFGVGIFIKFLDEIEIKKLIFGW